MNQQSKHVQLLHLKHRCLILCLQGCQPETSLFEKLRFDPSCFSEYKTSSLMLCFNRADCCAHCFVLEPVCKVQITHG